MEQSVREENSLIDIPKGSATSFSSNLNPSVCLE